MFHFDRTILRKNSLLTVQIFNFFLLAQVNEINK